MRTTMLTVLILMVLAVLAACAHTGEVVGPRATVAVENQGLDVAKVRVGSNAAGTRVGPREVVCVRVDRPSEGTVIRVERGNEQVRYTLNTVAERGWVLTLPPSLHTPAHRMNAPVCAGGGR